MIPPTPTIREGAEARGAAPWYRRILAHGVFEATTLLKNGEQLMVALILPAFVLLGLLYVPLAPSVFGGHAPTITQAVAATAATAIVATSMTSQAISTGFDRRAGVLRWIATTPLGRSGYMAGKLLSLTIIHAVQAVVLGSLAFAFGWRITPLALLLTLGVWVLATWAFGAFGLLLAGTLRAEATLALSNIIFLFIVALGGIAIPASALGAFGALVRFLPSGAAVEALLFTLEGHAPPLLSVAVLLAWALVLSILTSRLFRWSNV